MIEIIEGDWWNEDCSTRQLFVSCDKSVTIFRALLRRVFRIRIVFCNVLRGSLLMRNISRLIIRADLVEFLTLYASSHQDLSNALPKILASKPCFQPRKDTRRVVEQRWPILDLHPWAHLALVLHERNRRVSGATLGVALDILDRRGMPGKQIR